MKKIVSVHFEWKESVGLGGGLSYLLTTLVGIHQIQREHHLFSDERGFYDGSEIPVVFVKNLLIAKKRIEKRILTQLKSN